MRLYESYALADRGAYHISPRWKWVTKFDFFLHTTSICTDEVPFWLTVASKNIKARDTSELFRATALLREMGGDACPYYGYSLEAQAIRACAKQMKVLFDSAALSTAKRYYASL